MLEKITIDEPLTINELRKLLDMTVVEFADFWGMSETSCRDKLKGRTKIYADEYARLLIKTGITPEKLIV